VPDVTFSWACLENRESCPSSLKFCDQRPQFDALCKAATRREFDIVMAWSVDRLSRSVTDLCLHSQGLDTSTPMGKAMFQIAGVFAELERSILKERIMAGNARARYKGTKSGKPIARPRFRQGLRLPLPRPYRKQGIHRIAAKHSVGVGRGSAGQVTLPLIRGAYMAA
jgi:DNA invertase Pin-like site-specific DNA recombinase